MFLFGNIDLGASVGGAELNYNPTVFAVEIDQSILPVKMFKTKEDVTFSVALAQIQMNLVAAAMSYATAGVTTVTGTPATDTLYFGGTVTVQSGTFDWTSPKNTGTGNKLLGHLNNVVSAKAIKLNFVRDKNTEISKCELTALADLTQPAGQQAGWLRDTYTAGTD